MRSGKSGCKAEEGTEGVGIEIEPFAAAAYEGLYEFYESAQGYAAENGGETVDEAGVMTVTCPVEPHAEHESAIHDKMCPLVDEGGVVQLWYFGYGQEGQQQNGCGAY